MLGYSANGPSMTTRDYGPQRTHGSSAVWKVGRPDAAKIRPDGSVLIRIRSHPQVYFLFYALVLVFIHANISYTQED